jgi:hypothetical protein
VVAHHADVVGRAGIGRGASAVSIVRSVDQPPADTGPD